MKKSLAILSACVVFAVAPGAAQAALVTITYASSTNWGNLTENVTIGIDGSGTVSISAESADFAVSQDGPLPSLTHGSSFLVAHGGFRDTNATTGAGSIPGNLDNTPGNAIGVDFQIDRTATLIDSIDYRLNLTNLTGGANINVQLTGIGVTFVSPTETVRVVDKSDFDVVTATGGGSPLLDVSSMDMTVDANTGFVNLAAIMPDDTGSMFRVRSVVLEFSLITVPEPATASLLAFGLLGLSFGRRRRKRS